MLQRCVVVLDAGKTNAKLTLWDPAGHPLARRIRLERPGCTARRRFPQVRARLAGARITRRRLT